MGLDADFCFDLKAVGTKIKSIDRASTESEVAVTEVAVAGPVKSIG
jgi:hypothetical protein